MSESYRVFGIEIAEGLHRAVKAKTATRGISLKKALDEALRSWLGEDRKGEELTIWHQKLTGILESGDEATISAVTQNIDVFFDRLRPGRPTRRAKAV